MKNVTANTRDVCVRAADLVDHFAVAADLQNCELPVLPQANHAFVLPELRLLPEFFAKFLKKAAAVGVTQKHVVTTAGT